VSALYGPEGGEGGPESGYKEAFWKRAKLAGKSEAEIRAAWARKCQDPAFRKAHG
jgi:hypothetical protein